MPQRLRTFIAVALDRFTHDRLVGLQERLAGAGVVAKWVEPENLHITLLFLGEVDARETPAVCKAVEGAARRIKSFPITLAGAGAFPTPRRPRTLIVHVTEGATEMVALHDAVETPLLDLGGYRREERPYKPHLTLGRVKGQEAAESLAAAIRQFEGWQGGQTRVDEVLVMSSELRSQGPEYTVLCRARLRGK
jgi:RNA 2',3'-cyclic 3'-phosphodiesterase